MAKNHKKPNPAQNEKLLTAQNRNEFFRNLKRVLTLMSGDENTISYLSKIDLEVYYHFRFKAIRAEAADGHSIDPQILKEIKSQSLGLMKKELIPVNDFGGFITLDDHLTIGFTIITQFGALKEESFDRNKALYIVALGPYFVGRITKETSWQNAKHVMEAAAIGHCDLSSALYWTQIKAEMQEREPVDYHVAVKVYKHEQKKIYVTLEGINRAVVRVGWGMYPDGVVWCSRPPASFSLPQKDITHTLPVYIQTHALQRLRERLDCVDEGTVHYFVYLALKNGRIHKTQNNSYLIEFHFMDMKAGYLVAVVQDDRVIVRTFLLLTNNGTPEGAKLANYTGLKKEDKRYLSLDKLSTFMDPALRDDETIQRIFFDAGCSDLFEITQDMVADPAKIKSHVSTKVLLDYLMLKPADAKAPHDYSDVLAGGGYK